MAPDQVRNEIESNKFQRVLGKEKFQEKPEQLRFISAFFSDALGLPWL